MARIQLPDIDNVNAIIEEMTKESRDEFMRDFGTIEQERKLFEGQQRMKQMLKRSQSAVTASKGGSNT